MENVFLKFPTLRIECKSLFILGVFKICFNKLIVIDYKFNSQLIKLTIIS